MTHEEWSELDDFQSSFGAQCRLAAQGLAEGASREAVRVAFMGHGDNLVLNALRINRPVVNTMAARVRRKLTCSGMVIERINELMIKRMRESRDAVEGEWGKTLKNPCETHPPGFGKACPSNGKECVITEKWERLSLPVVNVSGG